MSTFHKLTIKEVIKETADAVSIVFDVPSELQKDYNFIAGQYITIKKEIENKVLRRAYSICSSPKSNELKVAIKAITNGIFSNYATSKLKVGDPIEVSSPEGKFTLQPSKNKNYIAFAAGSGITPILSMIKAVLENEPSSTFTLIYGNKTVESTIFYSELNALNHQYPTQFNLHYVFSQEATTHNKFGRIDQGHINHFIKNTYKKLHFHSAFLCGPEEMIQVVSNTLQENGFNKEAIHFELFTSSSTTEHKNDMTISDGKSEITVLLDDEKTTFTMDASDDILAASLRNKLDAPYSCQGGVCSSCIAKVTEGKAVMSKNAILTEAELEEGFILTCQAHPTTSKITVDFDDV
ncbi:2Fe-2S iron-sulfur cluster-binding protein [Tenacibaculum maritimum]|uniref:2Fe-2S iron-sulfur cluster-binding protein n=1 Tax=Tenacibaculum maritimum TaxID=107401 RepID=UPI0038901303